MMKQWLAFCLALVLLAPTALAANETFPSETSGWAREEVARAMELGISNTPYNRFGEGWQPVARRDFAACAASLAAIEFGSNLESYLLITNYRRLAERGGYVAGYTDQEPLDIAQSLGIIQGRGDGALDGFSDITRQEAAAMLARTYLTWHDTVSEPLQPLSFSDQDEIAAWALADVQLMNHLGIMTGVGDGRFDPLGSYTIEQCLASLLRLHEKAPYDGSKQENPFALTAPQEGYSEVLTSPYLFAIETNDYYICGRSLFTIMCDGAYDIAIVDRDLQLRTYDPAVVTSIDYSYCGIGYANPENAVVSEDGTKLIYTATVDHDVYPIYTAGKIEDSPVQLKGVYTVTMDLATGEQTYTRAEFTEN